MVFSPVSFNCVVVMIVAAHGNRSMNAYIHAPLTIHGPQITNLGLMDIKGWAVSDASLDLCRRFENLTLRVVEMCGQPDNGDMVMEAVSTDVPHNHTPVLVHDGVVTCQTPSGSITTFTLRTHDAVVRVSLSQLLCVPSFVLRRRMLHELSSCIAAG
jgi:hypothetical protein